MIDVRQFGAIEPDNTELFNAALRSGEKSIFVPAGQWKIQGSLDCTSVPAGFRLHGDGVQSQLNFACKDRPAIDCTGSTFLSFEKLWIRGDESEQPFCAFLFARKDGNGSSGQHIIRDVKVIGCYSKSAIVSISSEGNTYDNLYAANDSVGDVRTVAIHQQNELQIESPFQKLPEVFAGGNTVHRFISGLIDSRSKTGIQVDINGARDVSFHGTFFGEHGSTGIQVGNCEGLQLRGVSSEWGGKYGLRIKRELKNSYIEGLFNKGVYGEDGSTITNCVFGGAFVDRYAINAFDMHDCKVRAGNFASRVRNAAYGNTFESCDASDYKSVELPDFSGGNTFSSRITGEDGNKRQRVSLYASETDRLETNIIKANGLQSSVREQPCKPVWTPTLDHGTTVVKLTGNTQLLEFEYGSYNPGVSGEGDGLDHTFVFQQDKKGGHSVAFPKHWKTGKVLKSANAITSITVRYLSALNAWVQV